MSDSATPSSTDHNLVQWDEDAVFSAVCNEVRRKILVSLVRKGPLTAFDLGKEVRRKVDCTRKHLEVLRAAGLVAMTLDHRDGRRSVYSLAPSIQIVDTPAGKVIDFGFCDIPVSRN